MKSFVRRWRVLSTRWFRIDVVRFSGHDPQPHLHDHDRSALDVVLRGGGYTERYTRPHGRVTLDRRVTRLQYRNFEVLHRVIDVQRAPTWVLRFSGKLHGPRSTRW